VVWQAFLQGCVDSPGFGMVAGFAGKVRQIGQRARVVGGEIAGARVAFARLGKEPEVEEQDADIQQGDRVHAIRREDLLAGSQHLGKAAGLGIGFQLGQLRNRRHSYHLQRLQDR